MLYFSTKIKSELDQDGACVAAVKIRPVLHHCVVIFFCSAGIMECTCMLFTAHARGGVSGVTSFITSDEQLQ